MEVDLVERRQRQLLEAQIAAAQERLERLEQRIRLLTPLGALVILALIISLVAVRSATNRQPLGIAETTALQTPP